MRMRIRLITSALLLSLSIGCFSQDPAKIRGLAQITHNTLVGQTNFLASDWTEGRETGERGAYMSADYIASMLQVFGIDPGGDIRYRFNRSTGITTLEPTYFQEFTLMKTSPGEKQQLSLVLNNSTTRRVINFNYMTDFVVSPAEPGGTIEAPVVFVGYGYRDLEKGWDDFSKIDIKGKVILRLSGLPSSIIGDNSDPTLYYRVASTKDRLAESLGAVGVIEVDPTGNEESQWIENKEFFNMSPAEGRPGRSRTRYSIPQERIPGSVSSVKVSIRVANAILSGSGVTIKEFSESGKQLTGKANQTSNSIILNTSVNTSMVKVRNVIGVIEGKKSDEVLVIGAHYDHIGASGGYINNGADDNASGTVAVLTIAKAIAATGEKPDKTIVFALWTGEEKGLLGSRYFVSNPTIPIENIKLNFNFDMISRYISDNNPNGVTMTYTDGYPYFRSITEKNITQYNIDIVPDYQPSDDPPGGSDHRSFVAKDIPIMRFKPGHRNEYHTPADEVSTLNWDIMEKIVSLSFLNIWDLANNGWK